MYFRRDARDGQVRAWGIRGGTRSLRTSSSRAAVEITPFVGPQRRVKSYTRARGPTKLRLASHHNGDPCACRWHIAAKRAASDQASEQLHPIHVHVSRRSAAPRASLATTAGLFGALAYDKADDPRSSPYGRATGQGLEASRLNYRDEDGLTRRLRITQFEEMPVRLVSSGTEPGQIAFVAMAMACARRLGRPVHVFRGLPRPRPEFVAFDFFASFA